MRRAIRLPAILGMFLLLSLIPRLISAGAGLGSPTEPQRRSQTRKTSAPKEPAIDYSRFSHTTHVTTQKLACDSCHKFPTKNWKDVRKGDAAFADTAEFPDHSSCLSCHREQFFARERPAPAICSNCHVAVTPRDTTRFLFPSLGDVVDASRQRRETVPEFVVGFPHDKHVDMIGRNTTSARSVFVTVAWQQPAAAKPTESKSCPVCHQTYQEQGKSNEEYMTKPPKTLGDAFWLKKGTFKTIPNSHTVCASCHNADSGILPTLSECNACHKLVPLGTRPVADFDPKLAQTMGVTDGIVLNAWRKRISAGAFRHEGGEHPDLVCSNCHNISLMNTADAKTLRVPAKSCGGAEGCHITATSDDGGILNYEIDQKKAKASFVCSKCHLTYGTGSVPASHLEAIPISPKK